MTSLGEDLEMALSLMDLADGITMPLWSKLDLVVDTKPDRTPVSEADRSVERLLRRRLEEARPGDGVVGEEFGITEAASGRRWIVDPVDGTKNFVRRNPVWATLLALEVDGRVEIGAVSAPALGRRWWGSRGEGAWASGPAGAATRLGVSRVASLGDAHISGGAISTWEDPAPWVALSQQCYADRAFGDFWSHLLVAEGVCEVGVDPVASLWDLAPLAVIVEEAGGRFTDLSGRPGPAGGSGLSTNGLLHDEVLAKLRP